MLKCRFCFILQLLMLIHLYKPDRAPGQNTGDCHPAHSVTDATSAFGVGIVHSNSVVAGSRLRIKSGRPDAY